MLLINGKPVEDNFLVKLAELNKKSITDYMLKKPAIFKLQDSFFTVKRQKEMKTNRLVERTLVSPEFSIDATYDWLNPFTGMTCRLTYTDSYVPDEQGRNRNPVSQVTFEYGFLTVSELQNDLYFWLNGYPLNQTNPRYLDNEHTRPPKPFLFRELLPDRENSALVDHEKLVSKVILMLTDKDTKGYVNDETLKHLAKSYGFGSTVDKGRKDVESFMLKYAKQNPGKVMDDLKSSATEIRSVLSDAIHYKVIVKDLPYIKWADVSKGKRSVNNGIICQVPNGLEPVDYFVSWMREKDNSNVYQQLKKELDDKKLAEIETLEVA